MPFLRNQTSDVPSLARFVAGLWICVLLVVLTFPAEAGPTREVPGDGGIGATVGAGVEPGAGREMGQAPIFDPEGRLRLDCIFALDGDNAWVTGSYYKDLWTLRSALFQTRDGGRSWEEKVLPIPSSILRNAFFSSLSQGWIAGSLSRAEAATDPFVLRTDDGGKSWTFHSLGLPIDSAPNPLYHPTALHFVTAEHGTVRVEETIVENEEAVFVTSDGGLSWRFSHGVGGSGTGNGCWLSRARDGHLWKLVWGQNGRGTVERSREHGLDWQPTPSQPTPDPARRTWPASPKIDPDRSTMPTKTPTNDGADHEYRYPG